MTHEELEQKHLELVDAHHELRIEHDKLHARIAELEKHAHSAHSIQPAEMDTIANHALGHLHKAIEHHLAPKA